MYSNPPGEGIMRQDFTLYKRGKIWYGSVPAYDFSEKRIRFSTKCTTRVEAFRFCQEKIAAKTVKGMRFREAAATWWGPECPYTRESLRNGKELGRNYLDTARSVLDRYLMPAFGPYRVSEITVGMIEDWKFSLVEDRKLSRKSVNNYLTILSVMFDYWWRRGEIPENPCKKVRRMRKETNPRGVLTMEEAHKVLTLPALWDNPVAYLANVLAASTGMRVGEIQALRACDILPDKIVVRHSWVERYRILKATKTGIVREIPIDGRLRAALLSGKEGEDFIFTGLGDRPLYASCIRNNLRRALDRAGVSLEQQRERNICFHSWRHWLNSRLRAEGVPDVVTREITGHVTEEMTEHYTHITAEDSVGLLSIQARFMPRSPVEDL